MSNEIEQNPKLRYGRLSSQSVCIYRFFTFSILPSKSLHLAVMSLITCGDTRDEKCINDWDAEQFKPCRHELVKCVRCKSVCNQWNQCLRT